MLKYNVSKFKYDIMMRLVSLYSITACLRSPWKYDNKNKHRVSMKDTQPNENYDIKLACLQHAYGSFYTTIFSEMSKIIMSYSREVFITNISMTYRKLPR